MSRAGSSVPPSSPSNKGTGGKAPKPHAGPISDSIRISPLKGEFSDVETSVTYVIPFTIHNTSNKVKRIRFICPQSGQFRLNNNTSQSISPGLSQVVEVEFSAVAEKEYFDQLIVLTDDGSITVPLHAWFPAPNLQFDNFVSMGTTIVAHNVSKSLKMRNLGKRSALFKFVYDMSTGLQIQPRQGSVEPGDSTEVKLNFYGSEPVSINQTVDVEIDGQPTRKLQVSVKVVDGKVELCLPDEEGGGALSKVDFGNCYFGQVRTRKVKVVNNSPYVASFNVNAPETPPQQANSEAEDDQDAEEYIPLSCLPAEGRLPAYGWTVLEVVFAPISKERKKGFARTAKKASELSETWNCSFSVDILETEQQVEMPIAAKALLPDVEFSETYFNFGECDVHDRVAIEFTITNHCAELPIVFNIPRVAHFNAMPDKESLHANSSRTVLLTFQPNQLGCFSNVLKCSLSEVKEVALMVSGSALKVASKTKQIAGGYTATEAAGQGVRLVASLKGQKTKTMSQIPGVDAADVSAMIASGGFGGPTGADEGASLPSEADKAAVNAYEERIHHNRLYNQFLTNSRRAREILTKVQAGVSMEPKAVDLGMQPGEGLVPPEPKIPTKEEPLWLENAAQEASGDNKAIIPRKRHKFDENKPVRKKFKPHPTTLNEQRECKLVLSPKEVADVAMGPKLLDFGKVSVGSRNVKTFSVANDLKTFILVTILTDAREELAESFPTSQVIPPGQTAGFDIVFKSPHVQTFQQAVYLTINEQHKLKFVVFADTLPIDVSLSQEEMLFRFNEYVLEPFLTQPLLLTNNGNAEAQIYWEVEELPKEEPPPVEEPKKRGMAGRRATTTTTTSPSGGMRPGVSFRQKGKDAKKEPEPKEEDPGPCAFTVSPSEAIIPAGGTLHCEVTYTPGERTEHRTALVLKVHEGIDRRLICSGTVSEAKCVFVEKKVDCGIIPVGSVKSKTATIRNVGTTSAIFHMDKLPPGFTCAPAKGRILAGATQDILVTFRPDTAGVYQCPLVCHTRGGKDVQIPLKGEGKVPIVKLNVETDTIIIKDAFVGGKRYKQLELVNSSSLPGVLTLDLSEHPDFQLADADRQLIEMVAEETDDDLARMAANPIMRLGMDTDDESEEGSETGGGGPGGQYQGTEDEEKEEKGFMYRLYVAADKALTFFLVFHPTVVKDHNFKLAFSMPGVSENEREANLERNVVTKSLRPRLVLSQSTIDFKNKVVIKEGTHKMPNKMLLKLSNEDPEDLDWELAMEDDPALAEVFRIDPLCGKLQPGHSASVQIMFSPLDIRAYEMHVPVYLDRQRDALYTTLVVKGLGCRPSLVFDQPEVFIPTVPVGVASKAIFWVANEGYEQLEVRAKLPFADTNKIPLTWEFPQGTTLNSTKISFPVEVTMLSKKPISFTVTLDFYDEEDNKFSIPITGACDNCILTSYSYLYGRDPDEFTFNAEKGKPILYSEQYNSRAPRLNEDGTLETPRGSVASKRTTATSRTMDGEGGTVSAVDRLNRKIFNKTGADRLRNWLNTNVLLEPLDDLIHGMSHGMGRSLFEAIEGLYGRSPPGRIPPDKFSAIKSIASTQLLKMYEEVLLFLKGFGAQVGDVRPEYLVRYEDYGRIMANMAAEAAATAAAAQQQAIAAATSDAFAIPINTTMSVRSSVRTSASQSGKKLSERRFNYRAIHAWMALLFQVIKVFCLSKVTWKTFKAQPMTAPMIAAKEAEGWAQLEKIPAAICGSNIFTVGESLLLKWLDIHAAIVPTIANPTPVATTNTSGPPPHTPNSPSRAGGTPDSGKQIRPSSANAPPPPNPAHIIPRLTSFGPQLTDGRIFAALLQSYVPYLAKRFAPGLEAKFIWAPETAAEKMSNMQMVINAMKEVGLPVVATAQEVMDFNQRDMFLFVFNLYLNLPQYVPKSTMAFKGRLREAITKTIELKNTTKYPVDYDVYLHGCEEFRYEQNRLKLEPGAVIPFSVTIMPRFRAKVAARLTFLCKRTGSLSSTMVFDLETAVTIEPLPEQVIQLETPLYEPLNQEVWAENPYNVPGRFHLTIQQERLPPEPKEEKRPEEFSLGQFPEPFFSTTDFLNIKKLDKGRMNLQFLPFVRGSYRCFLIFQDDKVGEFILYYAAKVLAASAYEKLPIVTEGTGQVSKELPFYPTNPNLERGLGAVQDRFKQFRTREKRQIAQPVIDAISGIVKYTVTYSSPFFTGPKEITAYGSKARTQDKDKASVTSSGGAAVGTDQQKSPRPASEAAGDAGGKAKARAGSIGHMMFPISFNPKGPGQYPGKIIFSSPYDVRVLEVEGRCRAPASKSELEFACPARQIITQEIPITNTTERELVISCMVNGDHFSGIREVRIPANRTKPYVLTFAPPWVCEINGTLTLKNNESGEKTIWVLRGRADEPLAENTINLECQARTDTNLKLNVPNILNDNVEYSIESDLGFLAGEDKITVGRNDIGKYECILAPPLGGKYTGSITFKAPNEQYLWYVVNLDVKRSPPEASIEISTHVRKAVAAEITIANPADTPIKFEVSTVGDGLIGDTQVFLTPGQSKVYQLIYAPTQTGATPGAISFLNEDIGEFWYELKLEALEPVPENLGDIHCELGKSKEVTVVIENPLESAIQLASSNSNEANFSISPSPIILKPRTKVTVTMSYTPSATDAPQPAVITFFHPRLGKWTYFLNGIGHNPTGMDTVRICSNVGRTASQVVMFRNPFPLMKRFLVSLRDGAAESDEFGLLLKRRTHTIDPFGMLQIPLTYTPKTITQHTGTLAVQLLNDAEEITWNYPLVGVAEGAPVKLPYRFACQARKELIQTIAVELVGLQTEVPAESFSFEFVVPPTAEYKAAIQKGISIGKATFEQYKAYLKRDRLQDDPTLDPNMNKTHLFFNITFVPLRPFNVVADLVVSKASGGQWKYNLTFEAQPPDPDDVIVIEAPLGKPQSVCFHLNNIFHTNDAFTAAFAPGSAADFTVIPEKGVLLAAPTVGRRMSRTRPVTPPEKPQAAQFVITFSPNSYGKAMEGILCIDTEHMQWRYEIRGSLPKYYPPSAPSKLELKLSPTVIQRQAEINELRQKRNFMKENQSRVDTAGLSVKRLPTIANLSTSSQQAALQRSPSALQTLRRTIPTSALVSTAALAASASVV